MNADLTGAPRIENIEILECIGVGGMSCVYKARQKMLDRIVAVKVLSKAAIGSDIALARFQAEAKLSAGLDHPNIVKTLGYGVSENGESFLILEYIEGHSLSDELAKITPITFRLFRDIFLPLLSALDYAHALGITHRDIKPSNIILSKDEQGKTLVKLVDFGIAKVIHESGPGDTTLALTQTGMVLGSPNYMSPEQCQGKDIDGRSDLYSLACVMYESMNGEAPFNATTNFDVMYKHVHEKRMATRELCVRMEIPENLAKSILWGLNKEPSKRPRSAAKYGAVLLHALNEVTLDRTPAIRSSAARKARIKNVLLVSTAILSVMAFAAFEFSSLQNTHAARVLRKENAKVEDPQVHATKLFNQAVLLETQGKPESAIPLLLEVERILVNYPQGKSLCDCWKTLASCYAESAKGKETAAFNRKSHEAAAQALKLSARLNLPEIYEQTAMLEIVLLIDEGRIDEALKQLNRILKGKRLPERADLAQVIHQSKAIIYKLNGQKKFDQALEVCRDFDRLQLANDALEPDSIQMDFIHAVILKEKGESKKATLEAIGLANNLANNRGFTGRNRKEMWEDAFSVLGADSPSSFIAAMTKELKNNADLYDITGGLEMDYLLLARAYQNNSQLSAAISTYNIVIQKANTLKSKADKRTFVQLALRGLISLPKNDAASSAFYEEELKKLD